MSPPVRSCDLAPNQALAVGQFKGIASRCDIIAGRHLLTGGDPKQISILPEASGLNRKKSLPLCVADIDGNGHDDLVYVEDSGTNRSTDGDTRIAFAYDPSTTDRGFLCSSEDGLPDVWKTGQIKPNGYDLAALGCRVGHRDVVLEFQRVEDVSEDRVRLLTTQATRFFAELPLKNPDGSNGIALHVILREPIPLADSRLTTRDYDAEVRKEARDALTDKYHLPRSFGIAHWMRVKNFAGGVSEIMGDQGRTTTRLATFLHEFGHQMGLVHSGHGPHAHPPLYASIMSYHFQPNEWPVPEAPRYSNGHFRSYPLQETDLSERLPFTPAELYFLDYPPHRFRLKPAPNGQGIWIDWNRNGIFGEEHVQADINLNNKIDRGSMGDFDDISHIRDVGLSHSIPLVAE